MGSSLESRVIGGGKGRGIIYLPATILGALAQTARLRETGVWSMGMVTGAAELSARKCSSTTTYCQREVLHDQVADGTGHDAVG